MTKNIVEKQNSINACNKEKSNNNSPNEEVDTKEDGIDASFTQNLQAVNIQPDISIIPKISGYDDVKKDEENEIVENKTAKTISISSFSPDKSTTNKIVNTKYTKYNFLFYVTCQQFKFASSIYFFFIMVLQFKKELAVSSVASSVIPFLFVLFISMINEGVDDYNRHKRDNLCNSGEYQKLVVSKTMKKTCMSSELSPSKSIVVDMSEETKTVTKPFDTSSVRPRSPSGLKSTVNLPNAMGSNISVNSSTNTSMNNLSVGSVVFPYVTTSVTSANIKAGDIILIKKGERVPADCILLKSTENSGEVFIRTDQLDGETDWKRREVISRNIDVEDELIARVEEPNKEIYEFTGTLEYKGEGCEDKDKVESNNEIPADLSPPTKSLSPLVSKTNTIIAPVEVENTIWADTVISTCDVLAIVIYTGNNTKSKQNTYAPRSKFGIIDRELDFFVIILAMFSAMFSLGFTFLRSKSFQPNTGIIFLRFLILFSYVIPISLKVTINFARFIYTRNLQSDILIRTSSIQEELGRISYVLSDKTGTLTKNEMELKKLHLGMVLYDESNSGDIKTSIRNSVGHRIRCRTKSIDSSEDNKINLAHKLDKVVFNTLEALSTCHNVTPVDTEDGISYQASSPDEIAIVKYTEDSGVKLIFRDRDTMTIEYDLRSNSNFEEDQYALFHGFLRKTYKIHHIFPFSSDTKRMGIIISLIKEELLDLTSKSESLEFVDFPLQKEKEYLFFMKGADSIMKQIVNENDWVEEETDEMARYGLRTLIVGRKVLTKAQFKQFDKEYSVAKLSIKNRSENVLKVQKRLEDGSIFSSGDSTTLQPLDLLGLTGVEDKLQDNVKETLESLRVSGIKIWMLTGDKIETAISIAKSSRLLQNEDQTMIIKECTNKFQVERELEILKKQPYNSLVIDGTSISTILQNDMPLQNFSLLHQFVDATKDLVAVIGCRYTPTQKATMAETLKRISKETVLCIGDGGNDVSMITEADVGVGIEGKEGNQASLAADFSLKKFCLLTDLLFVHGRKCYKNSSSLAHIIIHRGTILCVVQGVFCALIYYIPISILQRRLPSLFICFTFAPLLSIMNSKDINDKTAKAYPELYLELRERKLLSIKEFVSSNLNSFFQGAAMVIILKLFLAEFHLFSVCAFVSLVLNEFLMVFLTLERPTFRGISIILGSMVFFILMSPFFSELRIERGFFSQNNTVMILCVIMVAILPKICIKMYRLWLKPDSHLKLPE